MCKISLSTPFNVMTSDCFYCDKKYMFCEHCYTGTAKINFQNWQANSKYLTLRCQKQWKEKNVSFDTNGTGTSAKSKPYPTMI